MQTRFNIETRGYNSTVFANLYEFDSAKSLLGSRKEKITELLDIIRAHRMNDHVGISLLHKHFPLFEDERLVRRREKNEIIIMPERFPSSNHLPYIWAFGKADSRQSYGLYPLEFISIDEKSKKLIDSITEIYNNQNFLFEILSKLVEFGLDKIFGLSLLPSRLFKLKKGETLIENDEPDRTLRIKVAQASDVKAESATQTLWVATNKQQDVPQWCLVHCGIHCQIHCGVHCQVHCGVHCQIHCGVHPAPNPCIACQLNPSWPFAREGLIRAKEAGLVTRDNWQQLVNETIFTVAEINALAAVIAAFCGDCLTKEVFG